MPITMKARSSRLVVFGYNVATEKIVWTRDPEKQHFVGDQLDLTGTVITGYYKDGTQSDITDLCTYNPEEGSILTEGGEVDLTASYTDRAGRVFDCDTSIKVGAIELIRFTQLFNEQYYVGDVPDISCLRVEAVWTDLSGEISENGQTTTSNILKVEDITHLCTFTVNGEHPQALTDGGVNTVEAHFSHQYCGDFDCSAEFKVGALEYLGIYVPDLYWTQKEDTKLNTDLMRVIAVWTDMSGDGKHPSVALKTQDVTRDAQLTADGTVDGYIPHIDYNVVSTRRYAVDGSYSQMYVAHPITLTAKWGEFETDTSIETNPIDYIWWLEKPTKVAYKKGESISYDGAAIWASYLETDDDTFDVTSRTTYEPAGGSIVAENGESGEIIARFKAHAGDIYESKLTYTVHADPNDPTGENLIVDYTGGEAPKNLLADLSNLDDWSQNRPTHFVTTFVNHSNVCEFSGHSPYCGTYWDVTVDNPYNLPLRFTWLDQVQRCTPFDIPITINGVEHSVHVPGTLNVYVEASEKVTIHAIPDRVPDSQGSFSVSGISLRRADSESWKGR